MTDSEIRNHITVFTDGYPHNENGITALAYIVVYTNENHEEEIENFQVYEFDVWDDKVTLSKPYKQYTDVELYDYIERCAISQARYILDNYQK